MTDVQLRGQYGKRNPLFMYQGCAGHTMRLSLNCGPNAAQAYTAQPDLCGVPDGTVGYSITAAGLNFGPSTAQANIGQPDYCGILRSGQDE